MGARHAPNQGPCFGSRTPTSRQPPRSGHAQARRMLHACLLTWHLESVQSGSNGLTPTEPMQSAPGCSGSPPPLSAQVLPAPERPSASAAAARPSSAAASSGAACAASARAGAPGSKTYAAQNI